MPTIRGLPIACPRLNEQRAIARIFGALDDKIELNRQMNETLIVVVAVSDAGGLDTGFKKSLRVLDRQVPWTP